MTVKDYITEKFRAFGITDAQLLDMEIYCGFPITEDYSLENEPKVGVAMTRILEELILAPRQSSVNESGFSQSWNFDNVAKWYLYLCKKYGVTVSDEMKSVLGLSMIIDRTSDW